MVYMMDRREVTETNGMVEDVNMKAAEEKATDIVEEDMRVCRWVQEGGGYNVRGEQVKVVEEKEEDIGQNR